ISPSNIPVNVFSLMPVQEPSSPDNQVSDGDKAGATLLLSGVFLGLVGMTFTAMGWTNYNVSHNYEWTQLLWPSLLSVGGTFMLISICKQNDGERTPKTDPLPPLSGPSLGPGNGLHSSHQPLAVTVNTPPQYYSVYPMENTGFNSGELNNATQEQRENRYVYEY
uniref:Transmembrane protein 174 n=1 Tax=Cyprinus carpio TaxID=7962 RepID=A0A8C2F2P5_CYPCA